MEIILDNAVWMTYNSLLTFIAVILAVSTFSRKHSIWVTAFLFCLWLLFFPNTIYVLTDFTHFFNQSEKMSSALLFLLVFEYTALFSVGIFTFFVCIYLFEKFVKNHSLIKNKMWTPFVAVLGINLLVSIGVMMGRVQRTNSWDVVTNPFKVIIDLSYVLQSYEIMVFIFPFWILITAMYYILKKLGEIKKSEHHSS